MSKDTPIATYQCSEDEHVLMIDELWSSSEDLKLHLRSDHYLNVLKVIEAAVDRQQVLFNSITVSSGLDTLEKARSNLSRD